MKKTKMALEEEAVKYIFPGTDPEIAAGEDGYVVYNFKSLYPSKLGIFLPIEIEKSGYSNVFPKPFEGYFTNIQDDIDYVSRLLETKIAASIDSYVKIEAVFGKVLKRSENDHTIFRIDDLIDSEDKTDLLCRIKNPTTSIDIIDMIDIWNMNPCLTEFVKSIDGDQYLYFIVSIGRFLKFGDGMIASIFTYAHSLRNG